MKWTIATVLKATGGTLLKGPSSRSLGDISTDTRTIKPGDLFVALRGDRFDGHTFLPRASAAGAAALLVHEPSSIGSIEDTVSVIEVPDTLRALGDLARHQRDGFTLPVVGITGSNGKTSTREMLATILELSHRVLKNPGNFNNLVGVPLTLLQLEAWHEVAVIEMGINVLGEMRELVRIAAPTMGLITNIQPAHLEGLGSEERVLEEKGLLWQGLGPEGLIAVNLDDQRLAALARDLSCRQCTYSYSGQDAHVRLAGSIDLAADGARFPLAIGGEVVPVHLPVIGYHQVQNAVAAAAMANGMGISTQQIVSGLARHRPVKQRMATITLQDGSVLVDDTYNANPRSAMAALEAIKTVAGAGPVIAVLGEMRELGPDSVTWHRKIGEFVGRLGVTRLITYGDPARDIGVGAVAAGLPDAAWRHADSHAVAASLVLSDWQPGAWVLVKGSRGAAMEHVVEEILRR